MTKTKPNVDKVEGDGAVAAKTGKEFDPHKKYTNGHKFYLASEAKALTETLHREENTAKYFKENMTYMVKPRNPLNGEPTPRDIRGEPVTNPRALQTVVGGTRMFPSDYDYSASMTLTLKPVKDECAPKIGVKSGKYDILGNEGHYGTGTLNIEEDPFYLSKKKFTDKSKEKQDKEELNRLIMAEKAKRHAKELERQLVVLKKTEAQKQHEIERLRQTFKI